MEDASTAIERKDLAKAKESLDRGMSLLKERQKLILSADKSPYGWKTVLEYKHHDLAENEENEKKPSIERRLGRPGLRNASSHTIFVPNVEDQGCLSHEIRSLRLLSFPVHLFG